MIRFINTEGIELKPGNKVRIYLDPLIQSTPIGIAELLSYLHSDFDEGWQLWKVNLLDFPELGTVYKRIKFIREEY